MLSVRTLLAILLFVGPAAAQEAAPAPAPADIALAEKLFVEGRVAAARGDHAAACARFDASRKLDARAVGTVLNLAMCSEKLSRYATAVALYREVIERSRGTRPDRVEYAEARLVELEPKVSTLRIVVPPTADEPGLEVFVDGALVPRNRIGEPMPIDGGERFVTASAPGKLTRRVPVVIAEEKGSSEVTIAGLEVEPEPPRPKPPVLAATIGGAGVAALAIGIGFGVSVASECGGLLRDTCKSLDDASDAALPQRERSLRTRSIVATVGTALGVVGIGTGVVLYLSSRATRVQISPTAARDGGGLRFDATF